MQRIGGTSSFKITKDEKVQLGRDFKNSKEMDSYLKENGLEPCHVDSIKPRETPMDKIRNSKSYQEGVEGWTKAIKAKAEGGIDPEVKQILGVKGDTLY